MSKKNKGQKLVTKNEARVTVELPSEMIDKAREVLHDFVGLSGNDATAVEFCVMHAHNGALYMDTDKYAEQYPELATLHRAQREQFANLLTSIRERKKREVKEAVTYMKHEGSNGNEETLTFDVPGNDFSYKIEVIGDNDDTIEIIERQDGMFPRITLWQDNDFEKYTIPIENTLDALHNFYGNPWATLKISKGEVNLAPEEPEFSGIRIGYNNDRVEDIYISPCHSYGHVAVGFAGQVFTRHDDDSNSVLGGRPAKCIRVSWHGPLGERNKLFDALLAEVQRVQEAKKLP